MQSENLPIILNTLRELAATKIGWLAITRKNHPGSHMEETHTTLFNLANPSQGRARAKPNSERRNADTGSESNPSNLPAFMSGENSLQALANWSRIQEVSMGLTLQTAEARADIQDNFTRTAFTEASASKKIKPDSEHLIPDAGGGSHFEATFKKVVSSEMGAFLAREGFNLNEAERDMKNDFGNIRAFSRFLMERLAVSKDMFDSRDFVTSLGKETKSPEVTHLAIQFARIIRWRDDLDNRVAMRTDAYLSANVGAWKSRSNQLRGVSYDGVLDHVTKRSLPEFQSDFLSPAIDGGKASITEITRIVGKMGFPLERLEFATGATKSDKGDILASFVPNTKKMTIYPNLYDKTDNTRNSLRAVINHELIHYKYTELEQRMFGGPERPSKGGAAPIAGTANTSSPASDPLVKLLLSPETIYKSGETRLSMKGKTDVEKEFISMIKTDGITKYSQKFWRDFAVFPSKQTLRLAIEETLAEVSWARTGRTRTEQQYINSSWLKASKAFDAAYVGITASVQRATAFKRDTNRQVDEIVAEMQAIAKAGKGPISSGVTDGT